MTKPSKLTTRKVIGRFKAYPIYMGLRLLSKAFDIAAQARPYARGKMLQVGGGTPQEVADISAVSRLSARYVFATRLAPVNAIVTTNFYS